MPAPNQRTPTQAKKTESHIVDAPTMRDNSGEPEM
jgi:hypothetical protein